MSSYTFYSRCWHCDDTHVSRVYNEACDWGDAHEKRCPTHRTEIDDVPDEDD
jgi:hypothetical protein